MTVRSWLLILGLWCLPRAGVAATAPGRGLARVVAEPAACTRLFGDQAGRITNRARRMSMIHFLAEGASGVVMAHASHSWKQPTSLQAIGVRVVETDARGGTALVEVDSRLAGRVGCAAGRYRVAVDDSVGRARILGVLRHGLLVEWGAKLRYVTTAGHDHPDWMMVWGSRYELHLARGPAAASPVVTIVRPGHHRRWRRR